MGHLTGKMVDHQVKNRLKVLLSIGIFATIAAFGFFCFSQTARAETDIKAVKPNGRDDKCGPYYIWFQTGPDSYTQMELPAVLGDEMSRR